MKRKRILNLIIAAIATLVLLISWNLFQSVSPATAQQRTSLT
ncbi:molybdate ABC transporter substrate-binding protein, partial [filamentous cyanobacterium Phorm 46]